jgi:hypothetical protein
MDHNRAVEMQAVERYLLGELAPEDRESFEEHYFSCVTCAGEVREAARFRANAREALKRGGFADTEKAGWRRWLAWPSLAPASVALMLMGVVGYQTAAIHALRAPVGMGEPVTLDGVTRGSLRPVVEGNPLDFAMPAPAAAEVIPELTTESGKVLTRGSALKAIPDRPFHVYFPGMYSPGRYAVVLLEPGTERELAQNKFEIVPKETNTR